MRTVFVASLAVLLMQFHAPAAFAANLVARVSLSSQTMTVSQNGFVRYRWKVSTARKGYVTPQGSWSAKWLSRDHRSRKYDNAPMPYAVFFNGGYAVHATFDLKRLGRPASHGCIRLHPENAGRILFAGTGIRTEEHADRRQPLMGVSLAASLTALRHRQPRCQLEHAELDPHPNGALRPRISGRT